MKKCTIYTIGKTTIEKQYDDNPDFSHMGKYTDDIGPGVYVRSMGEFYERLPAEMERDIDGRFLGKGEPEYPVYSREYNGIIPGNNIPFNPKDWDHVSRKTKSAVIKEYGSLKNASYAYALQDCKRLEDMENGHWYYQCIIVKTQITTDSGMHDTIRASLCGIESDSGEEYLYEIIGELKDENKAKLLKMGFTEEEIDQSLNNAEEVE